MKPSPGGDQLFWGLTPDSQADMLGETERVNRPSKYARLAGQLAAAGAMIIELTFAEVDKLIPGGLPESAYLFRL